MSLKLSATNTSPYNYFSEGDGSNPVTATVTLDNTGGTKDTNIITTYLVATTYNYTNIEVTAINEETGIDWQFSLDGTTWLDTVTPSDMNATSGNVITPIYIKAVVNNDGTVSTGNYVQADIQINAIENPS